MDIVDGWMCVYSPNQSKLVHEIAHQFLKCVICGISCGSCGVWSVMGDV